VIDYLKCPECDVNAIPSSGVAKGFFVFPTWTEDDEADCPRCGLHLVARWDENDEGMIAEVEERD